MKQYHIGLGPEIAADTVLLPGDPARVEKIAAKLEEPRFLGQNREYLTWRGQLEGRKILVMSTGMGGPSTAIGVEELIKLGVKNFIRIGTCGGMDLRVQANDIVIAQAAIRMEGTADEYLPKEFPAIADPFLSMSLYEAAKALGQRVHMGVVHCKDSFYGQHSPETMPVAKQLKESWEAYLAAHSLASEMESAALFAVAQCREVRAACVLHTIWNQERRALGLEDPEFSGENMAIEVAIEALKSLIKRGEI
ncbi:MAG: uridine phosphorylase [Eubacteriales bacterium]|nr:uridine phosphorylase [Eubacteriales bacterium]